MRIASVSNEVVCHDWPTGQYQSVYRPSSASPASTTIRGINWTRDGSWMAVVTSTQQIQQIDIVAFNTDIETKLMHTVQKLPDVSYACFQNLTKRYLAIASNNQVSVYDIKLRSIKREHKSESDSNVFKVLYGAKDSYLYAASRDGVVNIYAGTHSDSIKMTNKGILRNFNVHPHRDNVITGCTDAGYAFIYEVGESPSVYKDTQQSPIVDIHFNNDEGLIYVTKDRKMKFIDRLGNFTNGTSGELVLSYNPTCLDCCCDGVGVAVGSAEGLVYGYDLRYMKDSLCKFPGAGYTDSKDHRSLVQVAFEKSAVPLRCSPYHQDLTSGGEMGAGPPIAKNLGLGKSVYLQTDECHHGNCGCNSNEGRIWNDADVRKVIKETIKEELDGLRMDIKRQVYEVVDTSKKNYLDLQMRMSKEFIKIEEILNDIRCKFLLPELDL